MSAHHVHTPIPCRWTLVISFVNELVRSRGDVLGCTNLRRRKHFDTCQEDLAWSQGSRSSSILHRFVDYGHDLRVVDSHTLEHSTLRNRALTSTMTLAHKGRHNTQVHVYVRAHLLRSVVSFVASLLVVGCNEHTQRASPCTPHLRERVCRRPTRSLDNEHPEDNNPCPPLCSVLFCNETVTCFDFVHRRVRHFPSAPTR